ncbi:hypothetical protein [Variovorax boronicumulans]|uniref:hypothetical protein n=1 Tax=Variovorax boronicumulans TaxID=436515 RepID=UPI0033927C63
MITASGAEYHLAGPGSLAPDARPVCIEDIAHHLSLINRFTGATSRPYSVAEHSLLCSEIAKREGAAVGLQMAMLMHDAHEAYTTDLSSPAKVAVNFYSMRAGGVQAWSVFEDVHADTVRKHFKLQTVFAGYKHEIRRIDLIALATERRDVTAYRHHANGPWAVLHDNMHDAVQPVDWVDLGSPARESITWKHWREAFIEHYFDLKAAIESTRPAVVAGAGMVA